MLDKLQELIIHFWIILIIILA